MPHVQLLFMGGSPADVARMKAEARGRGVGERTVFSGQRPPSELPVFFGLSDLLASPRAKGENTPFKIFTYLASGRPLVATRIATHTQLLDDTTAFLVEPTPEGLASGIRAALDRPEDAAARAGRGRELVEREYSVERYREKIAHAAVAQRSGSRSAGRNPAATTRWRLSRRLVHAPRRGDPWLPTTIQRVRADPQWPPRRPWSRPGAGDDGTSGVQTRQGTSPVPDGDRNAE